jgi:hypothetical protein
MTNPSVWFWICRIKEAEVQVSYYMHDGMFRDTYD